MLYTNQIWEQFYKEQEPNQCDTSKNVPCSGNVFIDRALFKNMKDIAIKIEQNEKALINRSKFININTINTELPGACVLIKNGECVQYRICAYKIATNIKSQYNLGGCCSITHISGQNKIIESTLCHVQAYMGALYLNSTTGSVEIKSVNVSDITAELDSHYILEPTAKSTISFSSFCSSVSNCRSTYHAKTEYSITYCKYKNNTDKNQGYKLRGGILYFEELKDETSSSVTNCIITRNNGYFAGIDKTTAKVIFENCIIEPDNNYSVTTSSIVTTGKFYSNFDLSFKYFNDCSNYYTGEPNNAYNRRDRKWKLAWNLK